MKAFKSTIFRLSLLSVLGVTQCLNLAILPSQAGDTNPAASSNNQTTSKEFEGIGQALVNLLKTRDSQAFVTNYAVKGDDWRLMITTNLPKDIADQFQLFANGQDMNRRRLESSVKTLLDRADKIHVDFSKGDLTFEIPQSTKMGKIYLSQGNKDALSLPYLQTLVINLKFTAPPNQPGSGNYAISMNEVEKFPTGWRINRTVQWASMPTNLMDSKMTVELVLGEKIAANKPVTSQDDPSLTQLGESIVHFIRDTDTNVFKKDVFINSDLIWDMYQKSGQGSPSRKELDEEMARQTEEQVANAAQMVDLMREAGIDLKTADIQMKEIGIKRCQSPTRDGKLDSLIGEQFTLTFSVKSDGKAKNGTSLAGSYTVRASQIMKLGGQWRVGRTLQWDRFPDGVVGAETIKKMEFESYVSKYRALPAGIPAPEIQFTSLTDPKKLKLADFKGKVVILDFWATWCGPCQAPMAQLQKLRDSHTNWQDQVVIIPISIDDTMETVQNHVNQHGWTNTFNVWAGEGGWHAEPAKTFRVSAVPTSYVIDRTGKILFSGHPEMDTFSSFVDQALKK
jgi:thiol-disulfide isomerase/thioredoxin